MATVHPAQDRELLTDVDHAHPHASAALDDPRADSLAAVTWSSAHLEDAVRAGLQEPADGERGLAADLRRVLAPEQQRELAEALARALVRGPTRPHPSTRHGAWTGGLAFWFGGFVNRQRDVMDSRSVPTPHRTPVPRPMTRWGTYALGAHRDRPAGTTGR